MEEERSLPEIPGYRIVRVIGTGGMGTVYAGEKLATHQVYALKVMHEHLASDRHHAARFEREVKALREIRHPNVVEVYEWSLPSSLRAAKPFVVMELLEGETLQDLLRREPVLPPVRAVSIMLQVLDGLAAAHQAKVLHRDLGPSNVFLTPVADGKVRVKLLDFGLARSALGEDASAAVTQPGTLMGKPAYAPPELFLEQPVVEASDVFACGMMLFKMLTGRLPYRATTAQMLWVERFAERDQAREYPSVLALQPSVPVDLAQVVADAIRRGLGQRLATAREFQKRLLAVEGNFASDAPSSAVRRLASLQGEPRPAHVHVSSTVGATTASVERILAAMRRRRAIIVATSALVSLLAVVAIVWSLLASWGPSPRAPTTLVEPPEPAVTTVARAAADANRGSESGPASAEVVRPGAGVGGPADSSVAPAASPVRDAASVPADAGASTPAVADAGLSNAAAVSDAAAGGEGSSAAESAAPPDAAPVDTVRFEFLELPPRAVAWVAGRRVDSAGTIEVPRSSRPVEVRVEVPGGSFVPWQDRLAPDRDRTVRPALRRVASVGTRRSDGGSTGRADAGVATVPGTAGTVFATQYP